MTSVQASDQLGPRGLNAERLDDRRLAYLAVQAPTLVKAGLLTLAFLFLFWSWFETQHDHSWGNGDWSHAYVVPLISLYLLWQKREELAEVRPSVFWPGLAPMLLGIASYVFFIGGVPNHMGQGWSMILTLFGTALLLLGPRAMEHLFAPIAYLVFAVTVSEMVMIRLTFKMQQWAAEGAYVLLNVVGIGTDLAGNTLTVTGGDGVSHPLNVAEACSGMRMLIAFIALGAAVALVACRHWWQRVALLILAAPVAIFVNILRVASLGAASLVNPDLIDGQAHTFIGTLWLIPGFFLYMLLVWALNRCVTDAHEPAPAPLIQSRSAGGPP